jgi:hypothetical protein
MAVFPNVEVMLVYTNPEPLCVEFCNFVQCHSYICKLFILLLFYRRCSEY